MTPIKLKYDSTFYVGRGLVIFFGLLVISAFTVPVIHSYGHTDALSITLYIVLCLAAGVIVFFARLSGFVLIVESDHLKIRLHKNKPFLIYTYKSVADFKTSQITRKVVSRSSTRSVTASSFTLVFDDGEELEIADENFENFMLVRTVLINKLRKEGRINFSWIDQVREKEAKRREKFRR